MLPNVSTKATPPFLYTTPLPNFRYARLGRSRKLFTVFASINAGLVWVAETLRVAPKGMSEIHDMLMATAYALIDGGELGIFTPMHLLVFEKPAAETEA